MGNKSTVTSASITSDSLRTTIPKEICEELNLASGDVLDWSVKKMNEMLNGAQFSLHEILKETHRK